LKPHTTIPQKILNTLLVLLTGMVASSGLLAQKGVVLTGQLLYEDGRKAIGCEVICHVLTTRHTTRSDDSGRFGFILPAQAELQHVNLTCYCEEGIHKINFVPDSALYHIDVRIPMQEQQLDYVLLVGKNTAPFARGMRGELLLESKKNQILRLDEIAAQLGQNNARQTFGRIPGLNIAENDAGGLQLSIGSRGLNPNRSAEFNIRQNGYDISADPMGYPDAYYTPPFLAIREIMVIRGAGALQYGTQFGGLIQFSLKEPWGKGIHGSSEMTYGSFNSMNWFGELSLQSKHTGSYSYLQVKDIEGWRPNSGLQSIKGYSSIILRQNDKFHIKGEYTFTEYLAQQPGGLTDMEFNRDPSQSKRSRNWFGISWHIPALSMQWKINANTTLNGRIFGLAGSRSAVGNLGFINRTDDMGPRNLLNDTYRNMGSEWRIRQRFAWKGMEITGVTGLRYFYGHTTKWQGWGKASAEPDFTPLDSVGARQSYHHFNGHNLAGFGEYTFRITPRWSITPGFRLEYLHTKAEGEFQAETRVLGDTGLLIRRFPLAGIGSSYRLTRNTELYFNYTRNYRAINLSDIRVINPNIRIDPDMRDESGFTADLGLRGQISKRFRFDMSIYLLDYRNRIGTVLRYDSSFNIYRYRTNLANALSRGAEWYGEWLVSRASDRRPGIAIFLSQSLNHARYTKSPERNVQGKRLEYAPAFVSRSGIQMAWRGWGLSFSHHHTGMQYSDATNAKYAPTATAGIIPAWQVMDAALEYGIGIFRMRCGVNNLANSMYFTRRADNYPGPGIIPAERRNLFVSLRITW
jgi:Fe(3+) dicitrate transport protein